MTTVKLSDKFDLRVPDEVLSALQLAPGDIIEVSAANGRFECVPVKPTELRRPMREYRGMLRGTGIDATIERDDADRI